MKRVLLMIILILTFAKPVYATEITAPSVPESASAVMPEDTSSFTKAILELFRKALVAFQPNIQEAKTACLGLIGIVLLLALTQTFPGSQKTTCDAVGAVSIGVFLLQQTNSLVHLGTETVSELSDYGLMLLPVMTTALASQGGITVSTALYAGTAFFDSLLSNLIVRLLTPMLYLFLALSVANAAIPENIMKQLRDFIKWLMVWSLKILLYVFTGYIGITGVVTGVTDAAALKAAKLTISGMVPVVGNILSDASEAVLVSAGVVKNAAGIYGIIALLAVCIGPFLRIGAQYMILKTTAAVCAVFGSKRITDLIGDFSSAMGLVLAMTGSVCLLLLISLVCFLRGVG